MGTGTRRLTDAKTDPKYGPEIGPIVKEWVDGYVQADIKLNWTNLDFAMQCYEKAAGIKQTKEEVRSRLEKFYDKEEAAKKAYYFNKAISIAYTLKKEEIEAKKAEGLTFDKIYASVRSPKTRTLDKQAAEIASKDGQDKPAPAKTEKQEGWTASEAKGDNEKTQEDIIDMLEGYFQGSTRKMKMLVQTMMEGSSRFKGAVIDAVKELKS